MFAAKEAQTHRHRATHLGHPATRFAEPLTQVRLRARLTPAQPLTAASGPTPLSEQDGDWVAVLPVLEPNSQAEWLLHARQSGAGDGHVEVELSTEQFFCPIQRSAKLRLP
ncbi:MAG: hypothetical protein RMK60_02465 [Burkholderiales bacterium]|nr:hypothetical protein [Burkholderiales bacterium]